MVPNPVDKHGLVTRNRSEDYEKFPLIQHDMVLCETCSSAVARRRLWLLLAAFVECRIPSSYSAWY